METMSGKPLPICGSFCQILLKLEKTKEDKLAENNRNELLKFLNASYDWFLLLVAGIKFFFFFF